jgi:hypothetical protein
MDRPVGAQGGSSKNVQAGATGGVEERCILHARQYVYHIYLEKSCAPYTLKSHMHQICFLHCSLKMYFIIFLSKMSFITVALALHGKAQPRELFVCLRPSPAAPYTPPHP